MNFSFSPSLEKRESADFLVIPYWEGPSPVDGELKTSAASVITSGDFRGKNREGTLVYLEREKEPRLLLLGLGKRESATDESIRRAFSNAARVASSKRAKSLNVIVPKGFLQPASEGLLLANYAFTELKRDSLKENPVVLLEKIGFIGIDPKEGQILNQTMTIAKNVYFVRDLINGNADDITPKALVETALSLEKKVPGLKTVILDKKRLEEEKMGLILAVNKASSLDPFLIQVSYKGDPHSKEHIVLIGKGITYDTGGLYLKTPDNMMTMKSDMSGAATVLGAIRTAAELKLKVNVTALAPVTENCIGSKSYKLGDVYRSYSGKTVEINNTDAEGRLVLADAISYAVKNLAPSCMIDFATLTGSIVFALGEEIAGLFTNEESLSKDLIASGEKTGELLWRMPIHSDYKEALKSDIADLLNTGGRDAGNIKAALFLQEFAGSVPWVHIDSAGPCYVTKPKYYSTTKATGYGVRLFVDFLQRRSRP